MSAINNIKLLVNGGMDTNSASELIAVNDWVSAYNFRVGGTTLGEQGIGSNPESNVLITQSMPAGINKVIGGGAFEDVGQIVFFRYNSFGNNQIGIYDKNTQTETVIYTDLTDSNNIPLLPLNPQHYVKAILINETYLVWVANGLEVGYTNLNTLRAGGYGTVLAEDLSLLKPQCLIPITGVYGSDAGQPANYLYGNLPQFNCQYVNADFNYSAWSTWSKRIVPYQQNTPTLGADVTQNNYIIVSVNIGSIRATTLNVAVRFALEIFSIIKSVDRSYVIALPHTTVDVATEIYEAYDPATNLYSFVFYNNEQKIPVAPTQTDLPYDYIWPANAVNALNGNIIALHDLSVGYQRPNIDVAIGAVGYDPNIDIPAGTFPDPLVVTGTFPGESGSGQGNHKRLMMVTYGGIPHTGDVFTVVIADIRDANNTLTYTYTVPMALDGNLQGAVYSFAPSIPNSNSFTNGDGTVGIMFVGPPYFGLQSATIQLHFAGAKVANSIPTILDNTNYQMALSFRDGAGGRFFPLDTNNKFIVPTPSYAQVNGQAVQIAWKINNPVAPVGAVDYQWMITKPPVTKVLDVLGTPLVYKGTWDAHGNHPTLAVNVGTTGDTYQITAPSQTGDTVNLGSGGPYDTGDYVTYNGQSWDILPKTFGDITTTGNILAISINPLNLFNSQYADLGVNTILSYDFAPGDRCTLHYYIDSGTKVFINNPCVNLSVFGYDSGNYIVKVEKSATFDNTLLNGKNVFFRLYSPAPTTQTVSTTQNGTIWYEIGERFTITNGMFDTLSGIINDGGAYYKTRQYDDALLPYTNPPIDVLATDLNYSDFYASAYSSFGRPRSYYDELEQTERKAITITSQPYILGSKNNGLTRYYSADIYGEADGQTSSSFGAIQAAWQRGDIMVLLQELNVFYVPVNIAYQQLNDQLTGVAISEKLLNNGRYATENVGLGLAKEAFCTDKAWGCMVDPHRSDIFEITTGGIYSITGKMSKYFKQVLSLAYSQGKKIVLFYNKYYNEVMCCIEADGGVLTLFPFNDTDWDPFDDYTIVGTDVIAETNGSHSTVSYNSTTGIATYTPASNYVGNDVATFTFNKPGGGTVTKNVCLNWTAGNADVNPFSFAPKIGQPLSTEISSNTILVSGNDVPAAISITGGEYSINGGSWTSSAGAVNQYDTVQVRVMSSASVDTSTSTTLTISAQSATFTVTTKRNVSGTYTLTEQTSPTFVDGNIDVQVSGVSISPFPVVVSDTGSFTMLEGDTIDVRGWAEVANTGTGSQLKMVITKDGDEIYNNTIPNNPPPDDNMTFSFVPVFGSVYDITVTAFSNTDPPASCGVPVSYTGGEVFPGVTDITLGATTGDISLSFDSYSIPDKYEVWFDGVKVIDTGYRGDPAYQSGLDAALAARGLPPETIVSPGYGSASFTKGTATTIASVYVYAPMAGTAWKFQLQCPVTVDPFTFTDLTGQPVSTLIESNSITVAGNTTPATISVVGGEYNINGGVWTTVPGSVNAGDVVKVRQTSSASLNTTTDTTLTIAGTSDTFSITTVVGGGGYFELAVDAISYNYILNGVTGVGLPAGMDTANIDPGDSLFYGLIGDVGVQTLSVTITASSPVADFEILVYYSAQNEYQHIPIFDTGTYAVPLLHDVADPDYATITIAHT